MIRVDRTSPCAGLLLTLSLGLWACAPGAEDSAEGAGGAPGEDARTTSTAHMAGEPQTFSLLGEPLYQMEDTTGAIAEADQALATDPENMEKLIAAGRIRRDFWHYRQAMDLYTRAIALDPEDWRPYRFRGHRHISLREFDEAISDLERARSLAPLNWDVAYHLGLAYYVSGQFEKAFSEYRRCLDLARDPKAQAAAGPDFRSCARNGDDPESRVAMTEWAVRAALRAGKTEEAMALVNEIPQGLQVEENIAYYHDLLFYKGVLSEESLLNPGPEAPYRRETVGYGVANWMLSRGDTARAQVLLEELVQDPWWPGFGRIASEADLARLTRN